MKLPSLGAAALVAVALSSASALAAPSPGRAWTPGQKVKTTGGILKGKEAADTDGLSEYLGIPYAIPPTGERRFKMPEKYISKKQVDATSFGYACWQNPSPPVSDEVKKKMDIRPQSDLMFADLGRWPGDPGPLSEDCLTLNVWTKPQVGQRRKAVLVWFHGGGFNSGSSIYPGYSGRKLAEEQDIIVVSVNYRLNIFGFPGDPLSTQNLGFFDARMAMEWIRDNIAAFGGDVNRITMFGQSAGAGLVDLYSFAYANDSIATGFGLLSGIAHGGDPPQARATGETAWRNLAGKVGCPNATDTDAALVATQECMLGKDPAELLAPLYSPTFSTDSGPGFGPTADGTFMWEAYDNKLSAPGGYLVGNTDYEAGMFLMYQPDWPDLLWRSLNDALFTCPAARRAKQAKDDGHPTWRYRYFGDFPNMRVTNKPSSGAWHGSELTLLFNTVNEELVPSTAEQDAVALYMRGGLAAFAKDPLKGLTKYGWPEYSALGNSLIRLGYNNKPGANKAVGDTYDLSCIIV